MGFITSLDRSRSREPVEMALEALKRLEHRGAKGLEPFSGDGAGILTEIPFKLLGYESNRIAVGQVFLPQNRAKAKECLDLIKETFEDFYLKIIEKRDVPIQADKLSSSARESSPSIVQLIIDRPSHCRTLSSFDKLLYHAKQMTRTRLREAKIFQGVFFCSLSSQTIVYKALCDSETLPEFYPDLLNETFQSRFALIHRRFSTNTSPSWDKVQPFRLTAHNGEINTIAGNRSWAVTRERALGLRTDELLKHSGSSDSGNFNEIVEALKHRSSITYTDEILSILLPPANTNSYYKFWGRAMEPWDGPALIAYADGKHIGARLDRNGFRPCRWARSKRFFYLASETGAFPLESDDILERGALSAGEGVSLNTKNGRIHFEDPSQNVHNQGVEFDSRTKELERSPSRRKEAEQTHKKDLFGFTYEDFHKVIYPTLAQGKEPIGSMGDTARLAVLSNLTRPLSDFCYHHFAQVTNPPLDFLRERNVTDLKALLGRKPNIFEPKELIPPQFAYTLKSPVLSLGQLEELTELFHNKEKSEKAGENPPLRGTFIQTNFERSKGFEGFKEALERCAQEAVKAAKHSKTVMILSDREADLENPPLPMLLALRKVHLALNKSGLRLRTSLVVDSGEVKSSHELSTLIGFGASAVCPYLALECARYEAPSKVGDFSYEEKEQRLLDGFDLGLLKIMSKMGISAVRSYQSSELFNIIGLHQEVLEEFFPGHDSPIQGRKLKDIYKDLMSRVEHQEKVIQEKHSSLQNLHKFKEHARGSKGEEHSITTRRSKLIHQMLKEKDTTKSAQLYKEYALQDHPEKPVILRHLLSPKPSPEKLPIEQVEKLPEITRRFGTGAMSFGAISAESQRDLIEAMKEIGGRSNSGEGGENPYYYKEGITSSIKQVASGRFGVRAEYLVSGEEIQIKIAQGAKPGEGGQLMGVKVSDDIAKARFALPGTDLISPPPMHDIYSIEDLKGLIYEFKQLKPKAPVSVKLVSGHNIGNIAVGVVKAGADVIHISGGDGGTGAANLMSMKHAGLPLELGLYEVHRTLQENGLRNKVVLRADGSLQTGKDILLAALCGAQEFDFGKMLLVAEGCIMARVCEKNTCPTGIATQDPKYKKRYQGSKDEVVKYLQMIGEDLREWLSKLGYSSLESVIGRFDLIDTPDHLKSFLEEKNLEPLHFLVGKTPPRAVTYENDKPFQPEINELNRNILRKAQERWSSSDCYEHPESLPIRNEDRAIGATLSGYLAENWSSKKLEPGKKRASFSFHGSAGQGFGVFLTEGLHFSLLGDANDFVGKSMSGGNIVVKPREKPTQEDSSQAILGNACLYGATGGKLLACGFAGDRFAVRNSGALAVIEGAGWHACEYMTGGLVVILGQTYGNVGAGMTGGQLFLRKGQEHLVNREFLKASTIDEKDLLTLQKLFYEYKNDTQSPSIDAFLGNETAIKEFFEKWIPVKQT